MNNDIELNAQIQSLQDWRNQLERGRKPLCDELLALPPRIFYLSTRQRLQPFFSGGLGAIRQEGVVHAIDTEYEFRKTSVTVPLAAGIRILLPRGITVTPEARYQTASFQVRRFPPEQGEWTYHRDITRVSLALGYAW